MFNCTIFQRRKVIEWIPAADNLHQIKETSLQSCLREQKERQALLEELLRNYNEGRFMSFYCKACARMPIESITNAIKETKEKFVNEKIDKSDMKSKANILKTIIRDFALKAGIDLDRKG